jgi:hypothetical protein
MNIDKFCHSLGITTEIYIAVLEEEQRVALTSSNMLTRAKRIYDLNERERHRPIVREKPREEYDDLTDPYSG